jgi:hypothetical protein
LTEDSFDDVEAAIQASLYEQEQRQRQAEAKRKQQADTMRQLEEQRMNELRQKRNEQLRLMADMERRIQQQREADRLEKQEREQREMFKQQQDQEYLESLRRDQQKEQERQRQEQEARLKQAREEEERDLRAALEFSEQLKKQSTITELAQSLPPEPQPATNTTELRIRMPDGQTLLRRFYVTDPLQLLRTFIDLKLHEAQSNNNNDNHEIPQYKIVNSFPRKTFEDMQQTFQDAGLTGRAVIAVEMV